MFVCRMQFLLRLNYFFVGMFLVVSRNLEQISRQSLTKKCNGLELQSILHVMKFMKGGMETIID